MHEADVANTKAVASAQPGRRSMSRPRVRAANTVRKSDSEIFRYISVRISPNDRHTSVLSASPNAPTGRPRQLVRPSRVTYHGASPWDGSLRATYVSGDACSAATRMSIEDIVATRPSTEATATTIFRSHFCGRRSGITLSCAMVMMVPSFRIVMITSEMTGSVNDLTKSSPACGHESPSLPGTPHSWELQPLSMYLGRPVAVSIHAL
mmetsp:Transcript_59510/g.143658  ORF Transcript_59510/g.143658 Transcript_59510/m.143658 type:complete len:208 (+) Transcript_59510:563-1186(+)